ncbi:NmrA family transcriptional regulator [Bailinhaonella thermotolerans]|uniref:NmrA family transcriptional regulator n=1 Tax=Bailinhaonella thermotolerans TaxID=1070861 RepID=A0A3A4AM35_9ACTN|nr:NmrA family transcriptional regulator [Bailinhaonella thermotolerans]RJL30001.1 NmrA family transcriptional regulator [Bailinhaonella thermotolerans]
MEIAVTAPSGNVGRFLVGHLVRAGVRPRLLSRHPERARGLWGDLVDAREVDLRDPWAVIEATRELDALYLVVPPGEGDDPVAGYAEVGEIVAGAVALNRVSRTVLQSSVGAELRRGAGEIDGLARVEETLDRLVADDPSLSVAHLRAGYFFSNLRYELDAIRAGSVGVLRDTDERFPWVAPADIASVAASLLLRPDWSGRRVQGVHGPRDLSWDDVMAVVSEVTGHQVKAHRVPDDDMRAALEGAGLPPARVEAIMGMSTGLRAPFVPEQPRTPATTTDTSLESWARTDLRPALRPGA